MLTFPPTIPSTLQMTAASEVPVTTAEYCEEAPSMTVVAPESATVTLGGGGGGATSVTVKLRETEESATLLAVMVSEDERGIVAGAL